MATPLEELLAELVDAEELPAGAPLYRLSHLARDDETLVRREWPHVDDKVRYQLMIRLAELAEADFEMEFGVVFRLGLEDKHAGVREAAVDGLWEDEDVRLVPLLVTCLLEDQAANVRAAAATSLGRFVLLGELKKIRPRMYELAYNSLLKSCQTPAENIEVRRRAMESLAYVDCETVAGLISDAYAAPEEKVRVSAVFAMGRSANGRWSTQVRRELFSPNPEMRFEGARACGEIVIQDAVGDLEELADDVDPEVQEAALWALGQIGGTRARQVLERYCLAGDETTRQAAEAAMAEFEFLHSELADLFEQIRPESD